MKNFKKVAASFVAMLSVFATFAFAACEPANNNGGGNGGEGGNGGGDDNNTPTYTTIDAVLENLKDFNPTSATMDFDMAFEQNMVQENSEGSEETTTNGLMEMEAKANYADGDMDLSYKVNTEYDDEEDPYHIEMESYARDYELFFTSYGAYPQGTPSSEMDLHM